MFKTHLCFTICFLALAPMLAFAGSIGLTLPPNVLQNIQQEVAAGQQGIEANAAAQAASPQNDETMYANGNYLSQQANKPSSKPQAPAKPVKPDITDSTQAAENANNNVTLENQSEQEMTAPSVPTGFTNSDESAAGAGSNMNFDYGF